jgi:hypothetical protein
MRQTRPDDARPTSPPTHTESHSAFVRQFWRLQYKSRDIEGLKYLSLAKVAGDNLVWTSYAVYEDFHALIKVCCATRGVCACGVCVWCVHVVCASCISVCVCEAAQLPCSASSCLVHQRAASPRR